MSRTTTNAYKSVDEFLGKASWEGGVAGGIEYGLRANVDLTDEAKQANPEFVKLCDEAAKALAKLEAFVDANFEMEEM